MVKDVLPAPKKLLADRRRAIVSLREGGNVLIEGINIAYASNLLAWCRKQLPKREFTSRTEAAGVRIWRIE